MAHVTQQSIAKELGISLKTVQRAFNQPDSVSPIQRDRIFGYAAEHGYRPNRGARALQGRRRYRLGLFTMGTPSYFWDDVAAGAELAAAQIAHLGFELVYRRVSSYESFIRLLRSEARTGIDCIGLVNHTGLQMERIVSWAKKRRLPFAAFNIDFVGIDRLCYIGPDYTRQGELAGEVIAKLLPDSGQLAILTSEFARGSYLPGADIHDQRLRGVCSVLDRNPQIEQTRIPILQEDRLVSPKATMKRICSLKGPKRMVFCIPPFPDYLVSGIQEMEPPQRPELVGFDLSPEISGHLQSGLITAEIYQNPSLQGYGIVKLMETFLETGRRPPKDRYIVTPQVIFSSNVDQRTNFDIIAEISEPLLSAGHDLPGSSGTTT
jgi:DNA-binding LacI/PurR family transcriptional regulator